MRFFSFSSLFGKMPFRKANSKPKENENGREKKHTGRAFAFGGVYSFYVPCYVCGRKTAWRKRNKHRLFHLKLFFSQAMRRAYDPLHHNRLGEPCDGIRDYAITYDDYTYDILFGCGEIRKGNKQAKISDADIKELRRIIEAAEKGAKESTVPAAERAMLN